MKFLQKTQKRMLRKLIESFTWLAILFAKIIFEYMYVVCTLVNKLQKKTGALSCYFNVLTEHAAFP